MRNILVLFDNESDKYKVLIKNYSIFDLEIISLENENEIYNRINTFDGILIILNDEIDQIKINIIKVVIKNFKKKTILFIVNDNFDTTSNIIVNKFVNGDCRRFCNLLSYNFEIEYWFQKRVIKDNFISNISENEMIDEISKVDKFDEIIYLFENNLLPFIYWNHYIKLKIIYYSTIKFGYHKTLDLDGWLCLHWKRFLDLNGHLIGWNYSLIRFWATILYNINQKNWYKTFEDLYNKNSQIQTDNLLDDYYSYDVLFSIKARNIWVRPNLKQLNVDNSAVIIV